MIKLVASDIDGTLIEEGTSKIKKEYFDVMRKLVAKGVKVVVASGRSIAEINGIFKPVRNIVYYASNNGSYICKGDKEYYRNAINQNDAKNFIDFLFSHPYYKNLAILLATTDAKTYVTNKDAKMVKYLKESYKSDVFLKETFDKFYKNCLKINIFCDARTNEIRQELNNIWGDKFSILVLGRHWIDVCDKNSSKGNAINFLQKKYHIREDETVVMGDNFNDMSMLKVAKYSFVPHISNDIIKNLARYVIPSYEYDGPLKVLEAILKYGS